MQFINFRCDNFVRWNCKWFIDLDF